MNTHFRSLLPLGLIVAASSLLAGASAAGTGDGATATHAGRASVYAQLQENSLEGVTSSDHIRAVTMGRSAPTEIWRALEHGERVECLDCIPGVSTLLYDSNKKTREISAWWLRRRIFGVFGPGEVYSQTVDTLANDPSEIRRAYAAEALGEFLVGAGVPLVAKAAVSDASPVVRLSAVRALQRLNNEGPGAELATAVTDAAPEVRLAAVRAAARINVFSGLDAIVGRLSDDSSDVRRMAAEVLGTMRAADAVVGLVALTSPDREEDARVRAAAVGALGKIGDPGAHAAVESALADPDPLVQSVARVALFRL